MRYEGREWVAVPGTFIFEPPGDIHTLITEDEEVVTLFILVGSLQYFDENDQIIGQDDIAIDSLSTRYGAKLTSGIKLTGRIV